MGFYNSADETDLVKIEMVSGDEIIIKLEPAQAPRTVANFKKLVKEGFYNGLTFHRIIKGFMIQGGDPMGTGMGGSGQTVKGEFAANGIVNPISHVRGVISMARSQNFDSASSQFFICHDDALFLDGQYAAFGSVAQGIDVVDRIAETPTNRNDNPLMPQIMKTVCFVEYKP